MFNRLRVKIAKWIYPSLLTEIRIPRKSSQVDPGILDWLLWISHFTEVEKPNNLQRKEWSWVWQLGTSNKRNLLSSYVTKEAIEDGGISVSKILDKKRKQAKDELIKSLVEELVV